MNKLNLTQTELESLETLTFHSDTISKFVRNMYHGKVEGAHVYSALNKLRDYVLAELVTINKESDPYAHLKHAEKEGKTIQIRDINNLWVDITWTPAWDGDVTDYRIKPEPDPYAHLKHAEKEGKIIQFKHPITGAWGDIDWVIQWSEPVDCYRIKPQSIKRYLWANKRGFIYSELLSETEVLGLEYRLPTSEKFTIKLQWSETEFEV